MATVNLPPDFKEFLKLLNDHEVEYLLVGGYAVAYHGYPRATADMDIWIAIHPRIYTTMVLSYITSKLLKMRKLVTFAINIVILSLINSGGSLTASTNANMPSPSYVNVTLCSDSAKKNNSLELKKDARPFIKLISPHGGEVWIEGETYEIRWESGGVDEVYISVAVGGKDKGLLEEEGNSKIDAKRGKIAWNVPAGFITGFGITKSEQVRIMIFDVHNSTILDQSGYFTIVERKDTADTSPSDHKDLRSQRQDEYPKAIVQYYEAIARRQYREAYEMLGQCKIVLYDADGSAVAFQPRRDYESWVTMQQDIEDLSVIEVKRFQPGGGRLRYSADHGDAQVTLGIRTYMVTIDVKLRKENWTIRSGHNSLLVTVVKGADNKIRILGIGTGP